MPNALAVAPLTHWQHGEERNVAPKMSVRCYQSATTNRFQWLSTGLADSGCCRRIKLGARSKKKTKSG